ncbi:MAG: zinc ribbon domain-containing protein [Acidobacteriota bacterium]|jgi:predicted nucleic-acid-binding Zn-ribbon protein
MAGISYTCPKCANHSYETRELRGAGGFWSKIFDVQGQRFTTVICSRCRYTEFFHADSSMLGNIFDLFTN